MPTACQSTRRIKPSPLLDLPPELRNHIFELAVAAPDGVVRVDFSDSKLDVYKQTRQPALTRVSRHLRAQALPMYYHLNTFNITWQGTEYGWARCRRWAESIDRHLHHISKIQLLPCANHRTIVDLTDTGFGLEVTTDDRSAGQCAAFKWFEKFYRGAETGTDKKHADVLGSTSNSAVVAQVMANLRP
jgi:hypothetical protein